MKTKGQNSVLRRNTKVFFYIKMEFSSNVLENTLQKLSGNILNNPNLKKKKA